MNTYTFFPTCLPGVIPKCIRCKTASQCSDKHCTAAEWNKCFQSSVDYDTYVFLSEDIWEGSFVLFTQMGKKLFPAIWLVVHSIKAWLLLLKHFWGLRVVKSSKKGSHFHYERHIYQIFNDKNFQEFNMTYVNCFFHLDPTPPCAHINVNNWNIFPVISDKRNIVLQRYFYFWYLIHFAGNIFVINMANQVYVSRTCNIKHYNTVVHLYPCRDMCIISNIAKFIWIEWLLTV